MQNILILGAGKSATYLIDYLLETAAVTSRTVTVADIKLEFAEDKIKGHPRGIAATINIHDRDARVQLIAEANLVISMLPPPFHPMIAHDCIDLGVHLLTASYESEDFKSLRKEIEAKNLFFLNECGLDPGLDHMSAMNIIHREQDAGHTIISFKSYCGGLLAPESESNPWKYKFTWNPRNVVLAGQGVAKYIESDLVKYIPYQQLFSRLDRIRFDGLGEFEAYANRNSLAYRKIYGLQTIPTLYRGTLRRKGFCASWNILVQLGMTDDSYVMELPNFASKREFLSAFVPEKNNIQLEDQIMLLFPWVTADDLYRMQWLGLFSHELLPILEGSPAVILQGILEEKWHLEKRDRDLIVMQHIFEIETESGAKRITSSLSCMGEDDTYTAMAKTVGLPLALAADLFLTGKINLSGLHVPVRREIYAPVLEMLKDKGIVFREIEERIS